MQEETQASGTEALRRDLLWAIESPVLCGKAPPYFEAWAKEGIDNVILSEELLALRRIPIGRYFERLIQEWLGTREGVHKLQANLPVRSQGATLGEVDLMFETQGRSFHWELAVKFYLGTGDGLTASQWFGPQGRDRLDLKLKKLENHQLQLLSTPEGKSLVAERGLSPPQSHALIKGYLFHPFSRWVQGNFPIPPEVNPKHARGFWVHQSEVGELATRHPRWNCIPKNEWLATARGPGSIAASELESWVTRFFSEDKRPPMLVAIDEDGQEVERGFAVPDDWAPSPL